MATIDVSALNRQGKVFHTANVSTKAFSVSATIITGLILFNPLGSGVKGIILDWGISYVTSPTGMNSHGIAVVAQGTTLPASTGVSTLSTTPGGASADGANKPSIIQAFDAATLLTATVRRWTGGAAFGDATGANPYNSMDRVDGSIIMVPGTAIAIQSLIALAGAVASITWAELPV